MNWFSKLLGIEKKSPAQKDSPISSDQGRECKKCGALNIFDANFCSICGDKFKASVELYETFISYRRDRGSETASLIKVELETYGHHSYLDVDELKTGKFNRELLDMIEKTKNFILILSPGCLDRCTNENDWLRREITHALEFNKNIIPIMMPDFEFPNKSEFNKMPKNLAEIQNYHAVAYNHLDRDSTVRKILQALKFTKTLEINNKSKSPIISGNQNPVTISPPPIAQKSPTISQKKYDPITIKKEDIDFSSIPEQHLHEARKAASKVDVKTVHSGAGMYSSTSLVDENSKEVWQELNKACSGNELAALSAIIDEFPKIKSIVSNSERWKIRMSLTLLFGHAACTANSKNNIDYILNFYRKVLLDESFMQKESLNTIQRLQIQPMDKWRFYFQVVQESKDNGTINAIITLLINHTPPKAYAQTVSMFIDKLTSDKKQFNAYCTGLLKLGCKSELKRLREILQDATPSEANKLMEILIKNGDTDLPPLITEMIPFNLNKDFIVRACEVLKVFNYKNAAPVLREAIEYSDDASVIAIGKLLTEWHDLESIDLIKDCITKFQYGNSSWLVTSLIDCLLTIDPNKSDEFIASVILNSPVKTQTGILKSNKQKLRGINIISAIKQIAQDSHDSALSKAAEDFLKTV